MSNTPYPSIVAIKRGITLESFGLASPICVMHIYTSLDAASFIKMTKSRQKTNAKKNKIKMT